MIGAIVLTHRAQRASGSGPLTVRLALSGEAVAQYAETSWLDGTRAVRIHGDDGSGWTFALPQAYEDEASIVRDTDGSLTFERAVVSVADEEEVPLHVLFLPTLPGTEEEQAHQLAPGSEVRVEFAQLFRDGEPTEELAEAPWDPSRGAYDVDLRDLYMVGAPTWPDWGNPVYHTWYNRHRVVLHNDGGTPVSVPLAFDGNQNAAFYITGGSPLFRDLQGEPVGAPIQISKNWHGQTWYHLYSALLVPPGTHELELTFAHSSWGEAYTAAHAQLSLVGWGTNQQWDESSLGAWGETITYDPDQTLQRSMVDDVRPFLVDAGNGWGWTGNVGGADFLIFEDELGIKGRLQRLRSQYAATGPNLTRVRYAGVSTGDAAIEAVITTELGRTDDLVRAYYHLEYTFLEDVPYQRMSLFQLAADSYSDNGFTRYAYGNAEGVLVDEEVVPVSFAGYASDDDRGLVVLGEAPWGMLYASNWEDSLNEHLADVAFVVRSYEAELGSVQTQTPVFNLVRTNNGNSQVAFELGLPYDPANPVIPAGSVVRATVEYLVIPSDKSSYYGQSDYLTAIDAVSFGTTDMILELADGNRLAVSPSVGTLLRTHPVELQAAPGDLAVQFTLEGGLGYTPVTIRGLPHHDGWRLEQQVDGDWVRVDQSVEGNDYWQAGQDTASGRFELVFNVHNRGTQEYRLLR